MLYVHFLATVMGLFNISQTLAEDLVASTFKELGIMPGETVGLTRIKEVAEKIGNKYVLYMLYHNG